eukprot:Skav211122  [mRNA]  locus=scaffold3631:14331:14856:- [translate_table: standard]
MASSPKSRFWGLSFWQMLTLRLALHAGTVILLALCPLLVGFVSLPFFVMNVLHRQHLRQKFGLEHSTCSTVFKDVYTWLCCQPCATIQEALQVGYTGDPTPLQFSSKFSSLPAGRKLATKIHQQSLVLVLVRLVF